MADLKLRFVISPPGKIEYQCELFVREADLSLDAEEFADRYLVPCAAALLGPFEEPWPSDPDQCLAMLNRGGPDRAIKFYRTHH